MSTEQCSSIYIELLDKSSIEIQNVLFDSLNAYWTSIQNEIVNDIEKSLISLFINKLPINEKTNLYIELIKQLFNDNRLSLADNVSKQYSYYLNNMKQQTNNLHKELHQKWFKFVNDININSDGIDTSNSIQIKQEFDDEQTQTECENINEITNISSIPPYKKQKLLNNNINSINKTHSIVSGNKERNTNNKTNKKRKHNEINKKQHDTDCVNTLQNDTKSEDKRKKEEILKLLLAEGQTGSQSKKRKRRRRIGRLKHEIETLKSQIIEELKQEIATLKSQIIHKKDKHLHKDYADIDQRRDRSRDRYNHRSHRNDRRSKHSRTRSRSRSRSRSQSSDFEVKWEHFTTDIFFLGQRRCYHGTLMRPIPIQEDKPKKCDLCSTHIKGDYYKCKCNNISTIYCYLHTRSVQINVTKGWENTNNNIKKLNINQRVELIRSLKASSYKKNPRKYKIINGKMVFV